MSLATRCSACGTVFRVVQDQLKVSEGWVRCGRCNDVFSALDTLFDLPPDRPAAPRASDEPELDPVPLADVADILDVADVDDVAGAERPMPERPADVTAALPASAQAGADEPVPAPDFIRHAERQARWRGPHARIALAVAALVLSIGLVLQAMHHTRDLGAARWPVLRPAFAAWCAAIGCSLQAPRRIEDISVEASSLTRAAGPDAFRLALTLRNRGAMALAMPSIDLSLTETGGRLVARRALAPSDFRAAATLPAGAEAALQLLLSAGTAKVTGYTVEIFYP